MGTGTSYASYPSSWWYSGKPKYTWQEKFAWTPQRSADSGQRIWLKKAWYGQRTIQGPGEPAILEKWLTYDEYVWKMLAEVDDLSQR